MQQANISAYFSGRMALTCFFIISLTLYRVSQAQRISQKCRISVSIGYKSTRQVCPFNPYRDTFGRVIGVDLGHPVFHSFIDITYVAITQTSLHLVCLIFFLFLFFMHFRHSLPPTRSHIRTFITGKNIFSRFAYSAFKRLLLLSLFKLLDSIVADMNTVRRLFLPPLHHFSCTIYFMNAFYCFEL